MQRLEVSGAVRHLYGSLGVRGLTNHFYGVYPFSTTSHASSASQEIPLFINLLAPELFFKFWHTLYIKCE